MKTMVKLAMVVAVLLLLNGVSFAADCWKSAMNLLILIWTLQAFRWRFAQYFNYVMITLVK